MRWNGPFLMVANKLFKTLEQISWKGRSLAFKTVCHIFIICCNYTVYRPLGVYDSIGLRFRRYTLYLENSGAISCLAFNGRLNFHSPVVTICTAQWSLYVPHSGHFMYRQFNIQQFYVLLTHCIYLRTNSDYFTIRH